MPKPKNFTSTSAAMQFVCSPTSDEVANTVPAPATSPTEPLGEAGKEEVAPAYDMPSVSAPGAPEGAFVVVRDTSEKKTKRVQLLMRPTVWRAAKRAAKLAGVSLNEYIEQLLEHATGEGRK